MTGANKKLRIFHYERGAGGYSFADYDCTAYLEEAEAGESGGVYRKAGGSLRVMTNAAAIAAPGDWAALYTDREEPDKDKDYLITAVRDNRRGGLPHWRLIINGRAGAKINS